MGHLFISVIFFVGVAGAGDFAARVKAVKQALSSPGGQQCESSLGEVIQKILTTCIRIGSTDPANFGRFSFIADVSVSGSVSPVDVNPNNTV
jgi:hypothetical protein